MLYGWLWCAVSFSSSDFSFGRNHSDGLANGNGGIFFEKDFLQSSGYRGGDFAVYLVGADFQQRLKGEDGVAFLFQPARHRAFDDAFA